MHVDLVTPPQHESLIDLLCELHTYYHQASTVSRALVREHLLENLLGASSPHRLVVASSDDGGVIGMAAISLDKSGRLRALGGRAALQACVPDDSARSAEQLRA
jgi:hypothetical protein